MRGARQTPDPHPRRLPRAGCGLCVRDLGEDLLNCATWEPFPNAIDHQSAARLLFDSSDLVLQQLACLGCVDRGACFNVEDAELDPSGRTGVYGGHQRGVNGAGRFRSAEGGQVDFTAVFSKLAQYGCKGWAVIGWECALKRADDGPREGALYPRP